MTTIWLLTTGTLPQEMDSRLGHQETYGLCCVRNILNMKIQVWILPGLIGTALQGRFVKLYCSDMVVKFSFRTNSGPLLRSQSEVTSYPTIGIQRSSVTTRLNTYRGCDLISYLCSLQHFHTAIVVNAFVLFVRVK